MRIGQLLRAMAQGIPGGPHSASGHSFTVLMSFHSFFFVFTLRKTPPLLQRMLMPQASVPGKKPRVTTERRRQKGNPSLWQSGVGGRGGVERGIFFLLMPDT